MAVGTYESGISWLTPKITGIGHGELFRPCEKISDDEDQFASSEKLPGLLDRRDDTPKRTVRHCAPLVSSGTTETALHELQALRSFRTQPEAGRDG